MIQRYFEKPFRHTDHTNDARVIRSDGLFHRDALIEVRGGPDVALGATLRSMSTTLFSIRGFGKRRPQRCTRTIPTPGVEYFRYRQWHRSRTIRNLAELVVLENA